MKSNTKSSITLPPSELAMVNELMKKLKAKSKVEVIRRGLQLLKQTTDRAALAEEFRLASIAGREATLEALALWDGIIGETLPPYEGSDIAPKRRSKK